jgi:hypothetical protein
MEFWSTIPGIPLLEGLERLRVKYATYNSYMGNSWNRFTCLLN